MNILQDDIAEIVLQNSQLGVVGFDKNLLCTCWNPAMESLTGIRKEESLGRKVYDFLPYLQKTGEINFYKRTLHGETGVAENQLFVIPEKGKQGYYSAKYTPIFNSLQELEGGVVTVQESSPYISALQALERAEEKYITLVNQAPLPIAVFTEEEVLFVNSKTLELFGLDDEEEILGKSPMRFVAEHNQEAALENIRGIIDGKLQEPVFHVLKRKDETEIETEITYIKTKYAGKVAVQVVIRDVTQFNKAYQELVSHKQMLHEAQSLAKLGSYQLCLKDYKAFWTEGVYRILDALPGQLDPCMETYLSFMTKEEQDELKELIQSLLNKERSQASYIHKIKSLSGKEKIVKVTGKPKLNEKGEVESIVGTIQDVTEIRKVEDELYRATQILNLHFENSPLATIQLDSNLLVTSWSKQAEKMFGWKAGEVIGKHITSWKFYGEECHQNFNNLKNANQISFFNYKGNDIKLYTRNNTTVYCDMFMSGISEEDGKVHSILILLNDVTSRQISEQARLDGQLEERKRVAREIHDGIGQMLIAIKYKMASIEEFIPEQYQYKLHTLEGMIEQTLEEVRSVSRNLGPRSVATMGLETSLRQMCDQIKKMTAIDLSFRYIGSGLEVNNKIVNALYRIAQEATNNIIKHAMATVASIQVFQGRNFIELKVEDNGKGISENDSNGMGMKNMEERARLLGGRFKIHSEEGIGTNIIVNLPLEQIENQD